MQLWLHGLFLCKVVLVKFHMPVSNVFDVLVCLLCLSTTIQAFKW